MSDYQSFLAGKQLADAPTGFDPGTGSLTRGGDLELFPFQDSLVRWALRRGRAALFADTGLGKTAMQAAWAWSVFQHTGNRVLIVAPLCVAQQTVTEAAHFGIPIQYVRAMPDERETGIYITNYEMIDHFEPAIREGYFDGVVLDESSILKSQDSKTRKRLIHLCRKIPFRLSCTATPSPNDFMELGNQAEFLGVMGMTEMLSMFFTHDSGETSKWRLKGHGRTRFWEWLSHWAAFMRKPSDLGFDNAGYDLPPLEIYETVIETGLPRAESLSERNSARRETVKERCLAVRDLVYGKPPLPGVESADPSDGIPHRTKANPDCWLIWCNLNAEQEELERIFGSDCVSIHGQTSLEDKIEFERRWRLGEVRILITKPKCFGFGMNWQHCAQMAFVGLNDSYEQQYQAIRRCYRFGQRRPVKIHLVSADCEGAVLENIRRKEAQHEEMSREMITHMRDFTRRQVREMVRQKGTYRRDRARGPDWELHLADCVDLARELEEGSVDYSVFSPPFASLYCYSNLDRDMGNSRDDDEFFSHFEFLVRELARVLRPGRNVSLHVMNLPASKQHFGYIGIRDFRGELIRMFTRSGFIFHSEVCIWKDPVVAMQRTKALGLLWKQIKKDSAMSRQGIPDHVITFRKPGENDRPLSHSAEDFPVHLWQELASPCWNDIKQSNTLNRKMAREEQDERHICPLQLDLIERCLFLWSNPGDLVFSPFAGIGSEGYVACAMGRRFVGSELKPSYFALARQNLADAPRAGYRFPYFQAKIGDWQPGQPNPAPALRREVEADPEQLDWLTERTHEDRPECAQ